MRSGLALAFAEAACVEREHRVPGVGEAFGVVGERLLLDTRERPIHRHRRRPLVGGGARRPIEMGGKAQPVAVEIDRCAAAGIRDELMLGVGDEVAGEVLSAALATAAGSRGGWGTGTPA